jgi:hypothetical protein
LPLSVQAERENPETRRREYLVAVAVRALVVGSPDQSYREQAATVLDALLHALEPPLAEMVCRGVIVHRGREPGRSEWYRPASTS